ncbi:type I-E CRISPR-associated protein Cas5/CasD [Deltaproteobacteria bacterium TL4]
MNREYLLMPLWAPMQSWGDMVLTGDDRPSLSFPTHSGLCGLIAAALGLERSEAERLQALHQSLNFIVLEICKGALQTDFFSVKGVVVADKLKVDSERTLIGRKTYLADTAFLVSVFQETPSQKAPSLPEIGKALLNPQYALYAGRRGHPWSLPPVYHQQGQVPVFSWEHPLAEMATFRNLEQTFQNQLETDFQCQEALFKNQKLPPFSKEEDTRFYCDATILQGDSAITEATLKQGIPYRIRDRYLPGPLDARQFAERLVYPLALKEVVHAVSE